VVKSTIRDIAAAANVSRQTVSRVLNDRPDVARETRQRVWQVIEQLGYQPSDIAARTTLGTCYQKVDQPEQAIKHWEQSRKIDDSFAIVHRNLGWAYYRTQHDVPKAITSYEKAVACNDEDPRFFVELDSLYETGNVSPEKRLALLQQNHETVTKRNDSFLREIMCLVLVGRYDQAIDFLANNHFHVREGGGEIHDVYVDAHLLRGIGYLDAGQFKQALKHFQAASEYPENLSVGRPKNDPRAPQVAYYIGAACEALGDTEKAAEFFTKAADRQGTSRWPQTRFYQALACRKLARNDDADRISGELIEAGNDALAKDTAPDFFAKFGEQQTPQAQKASAHYTLGLGYLGKGLRDKARAEFEKAVQLNLSHVWAKAWWAQSG